MMYRIFNKCRNWIDFTGFKLKQIKYSELVQGKISSSSEDIQKWWNYRPKDFLCSYSYLRIAHLHQLWRIFRLLGTLITAHRVVWSNFVIRHVMQNFKKIKHLYLSASHLLSTPVCVCDWARISYTECIYVCYLHIGFYWGRITQIPYASSEEGSEHWFSSAYVKVICISGEYQIRTHQRAIHTIARMSYIVRNSISMYYVL